RRRSPSSSASPLSASSSHARARAVGTIRGRRSSVPCCSRWSRRPLRLQAGLAGLEREPALRVVVSRPRSSGWDDSREALFRTVLLPLVEETAEACGGFDWSDEAFERAYARLEASLYGSQRSYAAVAPVVGLSIGGPQDLGAGGPIRDFAGGGARR